MGMPNLQARVFGSITPIIGLLFGPWVPTNSIKPFTTETKGIGPLPTEFSMPHIVAATEHEEVFKAAHDLYSNSADWVTFYRKVLGLDGIVRKAFPTQKSLAEFEQSEPFDKMQQMLTRLRKRGPIPTDKQEPTHVITVRLPKSLHESLRIEAYEHHTSMNKLCISKLLQYINNEKVPAEA